MLIDVEKFIANMHKKQLDKFHHIFKTQNFPSKHTKGHNTH